MLHIFTDSMSDIQQVQGHKMNITVMPQTVMIDGEVFVDGVTLDNAEFYQRMSKAANLPKTSQVTPDAFRKGFKKALENEEDEILCITGSSALSGNFQSATIARDAQEEKNRSRIHLLDSLSVCIGEAILVHAAVKWRAEGDDGLTIKKKLELIKPRIVVSASIEDLKYLVMGGRLPSFGAKVGGLLNLKPMVRVADGKIVAAGVCRGKKKVYEWIRAQAAKCPPDEAYPPIIGHADALPAMNEALAWLKAKDIFKNDPLTMEIGSVVGSHAGPGAYGIAWVTR